MTGQDAEVVDKGAMDLMAHLVQRNVDDLAHTNRLINEHDKQTIRSMARAIVTLYEGITATQRILSTPQLDDAIAWTSASITDAYRILREHDQGKDPA